MTDGALPWLEVSMSHQDTSSCRGDELWSNLTGVNLQVSTKIGAVSAFVPTMSTLVGKLICKIIITN